MLRRVGCERHARVIDTAVEVYLLLGLIVLAFILRTLYSNGIAAGAHFGNLFIGTEQRHEDIENRLRSIEKLLERQNQILKDTIVDCEMEALNCVEFIALCHSVSNPYISKNSAVKALVRDSLSFDANPMEPMQITVLTGTKANH